MEPKIIRFDAGKYRDDRTLRRLSEAGERRGRVTGVLRDGVAPTPVMMKDCKYCKKPCPATNKGFCCVNCVVLFR